MTPEQTQRPADSGDASTTVPAQLEAEASRISGLLSAGSGDSPDEGKTGSGVARLPAPETLSFATHVHQYHREYIAAADQKAGFVFALSSALLVYLYEASFRQRWMKPFDQWTAVDVFAFVAMATLFVSLVAASLVVVPRLRKSHRGFVFFLSVAEFDGASEYAASVSRESSEGLTSAVLKHTYDLAKVARGKFKALSVAIWAAAIGVALALFILLFAPAP